MESADLKVESKIPIHYNIGHLIVAGGDTEHPDGRYLVADNKWTIERFDSMGPKEDPNFELIDISQPKMQLLYDAPIPLGEPHYGQIISAAKIKALPIYPMGYNVSTGTTDPTATIDETKAHIVRQGNHVDVYMTAVRSHFTPDTVQVRQGDIVSIHLTNVEQTRNAIHGFAISDYNIDLSLEPGRTQTVTFQANRPGIFPYYCTDFCSALHLEMMGYLEVKPSAGGSAAVAAH